MPQGPDETTIPAPEPLDVARTLSAPRAAVFAAWSSAERLKRWFCPEHFTVPEVTIDFRPGGVSEICMRAPNGQDFWSKGRYIEIVAPEKIVFESGLIGEGGTPMFTALTNVTFAAIDGGTRLRVHQTYALFDERALAATAGAADGWRQTLDRLEREVAGGAGSA